MPERRTGPDHARLDRVVAEARRASEERAKGYREQALRIYPWICGRCSREFTHANLQLLEVHHRDHNHDNNPPDGSNWELLCTYCHENEHQRFLTGQGRNYVARRSEPGASYTSAIRRLEGSAQSKGSKLAHRG
jgi:5-methylcytosine-specific restriction endonuclease McrA